jgi:hypothetical protein
MITSVAHQQTMCKTAVTDLHYIIHPMPSAQVAHGRRVLQDIHEGKLHCWVQLRAVTFKLAHRRPSGDLVHSHRRATVHLHIPEVRTPDQEKQQTRENS